MQYVKIPGLDKKLSRIIHGASLIEPGNVDEILDSVYAQGITAVDCGLIYDCLEDVADWIRRRGLENEFTLIVKGCIHYRRWCGLQTLRRCNRKGIRQDIRTACRRTGFDCLDLFVLHRDDPRTGVKEIIDALNDQLEAGHIRAFGASNWSHQRIAAANAYAAAQGLTGFCCSSPQFSLAEMCRPPWADTRSISGPKHQEAREWYAQDGMPVLVWSPLASGFLTESPAPFLQNASTSYNSKANRERRRRLFSLAADRGVQPAAVAIAYLLHQPLNTLPVVAANSVAEIAENVSSLDVYLSSAITAWLDLESNAPVD